MRWILAALVGFCFFKVGLNMNETMHTEANAILMAPPADLGAHGTFLAPPGHADYIAPPPLMTVANLVTKLGRTITQGERMEPLGLECMDYMRQNQKFIKSLRPSIDALDMDQSLWLTMVANGADSCVSCNHNALDNCAIARLDLSRPERWVLN